MEPTTKKDLVVRKELLLQYLPENPVIIDVGAHTGVDSLELARLWPRGSVHAIEAVPTLFEKLVERTQDVPNISRHRLALSKETGEVTMHVSAGRSDASSSVLPPKEHLAIHPDITFTETITVPAKTLPQWMREKKIDRVDFLWFDLQGYEYDVLAAARDILPHISVIYTEVNLVENYEGNKTYESLRALLEENGFIVVREFLSWSDGGNVLFVRKDVYDKSKLPITTVIVGRNEGELLAKSLESVDFCKEILYVDLESHDNSVRIAEKAGARVISHAPVPIADQLREELAPQTAHDWILFTDPDERIMPALIQGIRDHLTPEVGLIKVPCVFYFKGQQLKGTVWGSRKKPLVVHRKRASMSGAVHTGFRPHPGYTTVEIERNGDNYVKHLWANSWRELFRKHLRYGPLEGKARYHRGERASWKSFVYRPIAAFWDCFVTHRGYRDGLLGLELSLFWAWYIYVCYYGLHRYQRTHTL